jgi:hypothetical protein
MFIGKISYDKKYESALKGIVWKDINQNFKNDFIKTTIYIHEILKNKGYNLDKFEQEIKNIYNQIINLDLEILEPKHKPPE